MGRASAGEIEGVKALSLLENWYSPLLCGVCKRKEAGTSTGLGYPTLCLTSEMEGWGVLELIYRHVNDAMVRIMKALRGVAAPTIGSGFLPAAGARAPSAVYGQDAWRRGHWERGYPEPSTLSR